MDIKKVFILSNINMILFVLCYSLVMYLITRISGNKINKTILRNCWTKNIIANSSIL